MCVGATTRSHGLIAAGCSWSADWAPICGRWRRRRSTSSSAELLHHRYMPGHDAPAFRQAHPHLGLATGAGGVGAPELGVGGGEVIAPGGDHGIVQRAGRRAAHTPFAKGADHVDANEVLAHAVTQRMGGIPEEAVKRGEVVLAQRALVGVESLGHFGHRGRVVDDHAGLVALMMPTRSRCAATRSARTSCQGGAITCTPMGRLPLVHTGTATTGSPMKLMGWV